MGSGVETPARATKPSMKLDGFKNIDDSLRTPSHVHAVADRHG